MMLCLEKIHCRTIEIESKQSGSEHNRQLVDPFQNQLVQNMRDWHLKDISALDE